jgi:hypothetical protein
MSRIPELLVALTREAKLDWRRYPRPAIFVTEIGGCTFVLGEFALTTQGPLWGEWRNNDLLSALWHRLERDLGDGDVDGAAVGVVEGMLALLGGCDEPGA